MRKTENGGCNCRNKVLEWLRVNEVWKTSGRLTWKDQRHSFFFFFHNKIDRACWLVFGMGKGKMNETSYNSFPILHE